MAIRHTLFAYLFVVVIVCLSTGCRNKSEAQKQVALLHEHHSPHGGTAVVLGDELYHLELVRDSNEGTLTAYVLDSEMENFVRIEQTTLTLNIKTNTSVLPLTLSAVENSATGEKIGDTSEFQIKSEFITRTAEFDADLKLITVNKYSFSEVHFNFPRGNDRD